MIYGWLHYIQSIAPQSRIANLHSYARCISVMFLAKLHVGCVAIPLQFLPSPSKPSLHLHSKLPILLIQTAFSEQSFLSVAHSSISTGKCKQVSLNCTYRECRDCTSTNYSIAFIAHPTFTLEATRCIHTISISITIVAVQSTFINIYTTKKDN